MIDVVIAGAPEEIEAVKFLILAHASALREHPGSEDIRTDAMGLPGPYAGPRGRLYLARLDAAPAGCVALRSFQDAIGEVKRMFVLPILRRHGVARALMERLLGDAARMGYNRIRLGTLSDMTAAQTLYRELGFIEIPRYRVDEKVDTVFFECDLSARR